MNFAEVAAEQWRDYPERHQNRTNLLIHIVTVPLVWFAALQVFAGLVLMLVGVGGLKMWVSAAILVAIALFAQSYGNGMEAKKSAPPTNPKDFAMHAAAEQFITFPRFVLSGGWLRNFQST
ncbi:MAG: Mpo1-like protein [Gammaproteobacteria bacterium]